MDAHRGSIFCTCSHDTHSPDSPHVTSFTAHSLTAHGGWAKKIDPLQSCLLMSSLYLSLSYDISLMDMSYVLWLILCLMSYMSYVYLLISYILCLISYVLCLICLMYTFLHRISYVLYLMSDMSYMSYVYLLMLCLSCLWLISCVSCLMCLVL